MDGAQFNRVLQERADEQNENGLLSKVLNEEDIKSDIKTNTDDVCGG